MKYPQNIWYYNGKKVLSTWIKTKDVERFQPITQVYGIIFNKANEILICKQKGHKDWNIPGGHPEKGETIEETLRRELLEEVDVKVENIIPIGVVKGIFPDEPDSKFLYQVRCVATLKELLPQTPDPDNGKTWERRFIPAEKITEYIKWGQMGEAVFKDAIEVWNQTGKLHIFT